MASHSIMLSWHFLIKLLTLWQLICEHTLVCVSIWMELVSSLLWNSDQWGFACPRDTANVPLNNESPYLPDWGEPLHDRKMKQYNNSCEGQNRGGVSLTIWYTTCTFVLFFWVSFCACRRTCQRQTVMWSESQSSSLWLMVRKNDQIFADPFLRSTAQTVIAVWWLYFNMLILLTNCRANDVHVLITGNLRGNLCNLTSWELVTNKQTNKLMMF